jgi:hypothetical protein
MVRSNGCPTWPSVICQGRKTIVVPPARDKDRGEVHLGQPIVMIERPGPLGPKRGAIALGPDDPHIQITAQRSARASFPQDATSCAHNRPRALQLSRDRIRYSSSR